ncbi:hypothetical protein SLS59_003600 [Nothophoma quercina]|uniref:DUF7791 domain-containing protein n=1 Tax=Nothophoma quercina TaxID=749835 RepID=A0ABR3RMZ1_9PLEO
MSYKVVFFIDGLDEFVGDPSEIIDLVSNFLEAGVKVCASSRPWVAFEDAYGQRPHLRLQDLTQSDIKHYVTARLQDKPGFKLMERVYPDECRDMIDSVCEKSSGVFLWIVLVTRSLLEGLTDGDGIVHLQERLDNLPEDLEELFEKILKNLNRRNFPRACRLLKIHRSSTVALTLLDMSFVDNDHDGPDFALDMPLVVWDLEKKNDRANLTDRQLMALCKGLLEANRSETTRPFTAQIGYLHRTVRDFLEQDHVWSQVESAAGADFNHNMALYDVHLMRIKILTYTGITLRELWGSISSSIFYATKAEDDGSERQIKMLNEIDRAVTRAFTTPLPNKLTFQQTSGFHEQMYWFTNREGSKHQCSFLELAVLLLLYGYVEATLSAMTENQVKQQVPNLVHTALKHIDLRHLGLTLLPPTFTRPSPDQKMLQLLFRYGTDSAWISLDGSTPWSQLMGEVHYPNKFKILQLFIDTGGDPIHELVEKSEFKSIMPDNVKALLKRRKWSRYLRTSGPSGQRGGNHK